MNFEKNKILIFSYDDAVTQDARLIEIMNKYGIKGTFNLNSERLGRQDEHVCFGVKVSHCKFNPEDIKTVYSGHEVAAHTLTHPRLPDISDDEAVIRQVEQDRKKLSELVGYEVTSFAYPCGGVNNDERVAALIKNHTGIKNARTITSTYSLKMPNDLYRLDPTVHFPGNIEETFRLAKEFIDADASEPMLFFIWGHSYELDALGAWDKFEELCKLLGGRDDILYAGASILNKVG